MMPDDNWKKWFAREKQKLTKTELRKGKRGYLHFDKRIIDLDETQTKTLLGPDNVIKHPFYPFIRIDTREERFRRPKIRKPGDPRREHSVKKRPIDYAAHKDALIFSWYSYLLNLKYEEELARRGIGNHVVAYRALKDASGNGKTNIHFAKEAFDFIEAQQPCYVLAIDVTKFFEEINHELLKTQWATLLGHTTLPPDHYKVFRAITDYRFVRKGRIVKHMEFAKRRGLSRIFTPQEFKENVIDKHLQEKGHFGEKLVGIPQGAPISCLLANAYMLKFDTAVAAFIATIPKGFYQRYSDDILVVCTPEDAEKVQKFIIEEIEKLKLRIKPEKTEHRLFVTNDDVTQSLDPASGVQMRLQYLGIETDGVNRQLRHGAIARFQRRRNRGVRRVSSFSMAKGAKIPKRYLHKKYALPNNNFLGYAKRAEGILETGNIPQQVSILKAGKELKNLITKIKRSQARQR